MPRKSAREQILQAGVETLHTQGFNGAGVQDITQAAGVPKGSFYNHFESKEALGVEALEQYWQRGVEALADLREGDDLAIVQLQRYFARLDALARKRRYERGCLIGNLSIEMADHSEAIRRKLGSVFKTWCKEIEICIARGQGEGSIRNDVSADILAAFMLNAWQGSIARARVDHNGSALRAFEAVMFVTLHP